MMGYYGIEHYFYGPRLHEYLKEMRRETFDNYDVFSVGETPGTGIEMSRLLTSEQRRELDMIFSFDHLEPPGKVRFDDYKYDLNYLKEYYINWMQNYGNDCWNTIFFENHDNPRMISKINPDSKYRDVLGKLLAMLQLTLKGTPFIFQGQELGTINTAFTSIEQFKDVESINLYNELLPASGNSDALKKILSGSRDHARTPMQWNSGANGGFTTSEPWIYMSDDYKKYNAKDELENPLSILNFYKKLIALRKSDEALIYGEFIPEARKKKNLFCYYRTLGETKYYVELNLTDGTQKRPVKYGSFKLILSNYEDRHDSLRPYEANFYKCD
jgi:oligo-1,6-glucosidase